MVKHDHLGMASVPVLRKGHTDEGRAVCLEQRGQGNEAKAVLRKTRPLEGKSRALLRARLWRNFQTDSSNVVLWRQEGLGISNLLIFFLWRS